MKWSKLKRLVLDNFSSSLNGRVDINSTAYGNCRCGHAWITIDKKIVANFCTRAYSNRHVYDYINGRYLVLDLTKNEVARYREQYVEYGDFSRQDFYQSCWSFVHEMSIERALESPDLIIRSLALLDKRVGKRRLKKVNVERLDRLPQEMFRIRALAENLLVPTKVSMM